MDASDTKIKTLQANVDKVPAFIEQLYSFRQEIHENRRAEWNDEVKKIRENIGSDQILLFIGPYSSGKTTLINALLGKDRLPTADKPCTSVVTELQFVKGGGDRGKQYKMDDTVEEDDYTELIKMIDGPTGAIGKVGQIHHIELQFDIQRLDDWESHPLASLANLNIKIVDCPGYGSAYIIDEDIINGYIEKASYTFWLSPIDKFGGRDAERRLSGIKKKTTAIIPIITCSDRGGEAEREQVRDSFYENLAHLFPKYKEPRFVSAFYYKKAQELREKLRNDERKETMTKEEKGKINAEIERLVLQSGLEQIFRDMVNSAQKKVVADTRVDSVLYDLEKLLNDIERAARREKDYWFAQAEKKGFRQDDEYAKLNQIKSRVESWIKGEAKSTADIIEVTLTTDILTYIMKTNGKVESQEAQRIIHDVWEKELNGRTKNWSEYLQKAYGEYARDAVTIETDKGKQLTPPELGNIMTDLTTGIMGILSSFRYAGAQSVMTTGLGAALIAGKAAIGSVALVGGVLSSVALFAGIGLIAVGAIPLIPLMVDKVKSGKEKAREETEIKLKAWVKTLNLTPVIQVILNEANTKLYDNYKIQYDVDLELPVRNYQKCGEIETEINEAKETLRATFGDTNKGRKV